MKKRFTEERIIGILKEAEAGMKIAEVCRTYGISEATYYNWKAKFGGSPLGHFGFKGCCQPKVVSPQARRDAMVHVMNEHRLALPGFVG